MIIKEFRVLAPVDLRTCCINNEWYTRGTVKDYENLFSLVSLKNGGHKKITTAALQRIAEDIIAHSDIEGMELPAVMCELCRYTFTFFSEN